MTVFHRTVAVLAVVTPLIAAACADQPTDPSINKQPQFSETVEDVQVFGDPSVGTAAFLTNLNQVLVAQGAGYGALQADLLLAPDTPERATTIFANDRTHQIGYRFVAGDPRRTATGLAIRQASFLPLSLAPIGGGAFAPAKPNINAAFATWTGVSCSTVQVAATTLPANVIPSAILGIPGFVNNPSLADVNTVGFLPGAIFEAVFGPGSSAVILGVTIPFAFADAAGEFTDIDQDGNADLAFAEIWYNARFRWTITGTTPGIDVQSVALHENGHALGLAHFGLLFATDNDKIHFAPLAVMNAAYTGIKRSPLGTDNASFCSLWGSFPN